MGALLSKFVKAIGIVVLVGLINGCSKPVTHGNLLVGSWVSRCPCGFRLVINQSNMYSILGGDTGVYPYFVRNDSVFIETTLSGPPAPFYSFAALSFNNTEMEMNLKYDLFMPGCGCPDSTFNFQRN